MKRRFNRIFTAIWVGVSCALVANYIPLISQTTHILHNMGNQSFTDILICPSKVETKYVTILNWIEDIMTTIGSLFFFIPYIGYGICTMFVILWRLFKWKTGYRTHFHVHDMPLSHSYNPDIEVNISNTFTVLMAKRILRFVCISLLHWPTKTVVLVILSWNLKLYIKTQ